MPDAKPSKGGRPSKSEVDAATLKEIRGLGKIQATYRECAAFFSISIPTFEKMLAQPGVRDAFEEGKAQGLISLRRKQFQMAEKSAAMAIFLGKNYLDQTDKVATELTGREGGPLSVAPAPALDYSKLSVGELRQLHALTTKAALPAPLESIEGNGQP